MPESSRADSLVMSYLALRKSIGGIGIALPFAVALGRMLIESPGVLNSISAYYYSVMGNVFVGSLCAIAVFLFSYRGYDWRDALSGRIAGVCALGTAFFPTAPTNTPTATQLFVGYFHFVFAISFFITLSYFALVLFRKTNPLFEPTHMKHYRNMVYLVCGVTMLVCIASVIAIELFLRETAIMSYHTIFWLESLAIESFGISWLIKSEALLKDS